MLRADRSPDRSIATTALLLGICSCAHTTPCERLLVAVRDRPVSTELRQRMIDDRLEDREAERAHVTVTEDEIDRGVTNIFTQAEAQQGHPVTLNDLFDEVRRRGLSEQEFRDGIRRQILEGKLIDLRVRPRVRVTDADAHAAYQRWTHELKDEQPVDVRILALRVPTTWTKPQIEARTALAEELARQARGGEDFCQLVAQYSDDVSTKDSCGSHGAQPLANLLPPIQQALQTLEAGSISAPIPMTVGQDQVLVVLQPLGQARIPPFDEVKSEMMQRALVDGLDRARKEWLEELRRNVCVDRR